MPNPSPLKQKRPLTDDDLERIAIEVMDLPDDQAQAEYDRRVREKENL